MSYLSQILYHCLPDPKFLDRGLSNIDQVIERKRYGFNTEEFIKVLLVDGYAPDSDFYDSELLDLWETPRLKQAKEQSLHRNIVLHKFCERRILPIELFRISPSEIDGMDIGQIASRASAKLKISHTESLNLIAALLDLDNINSVGCFEKDLADAVFIWKLIPRVCVPSLTLLDELGCEVEYEFEEGVPIWYDVIRDDFASKLLDTSSNWKRYIDHYLVFLDRPVDALQVCPENVLAKVNNTKEYLYPKLVKIITGSSEELPYHIALYTIARAIIYQMIHGSATTVAREIYPAKFKNGETDAFFSCASGHDVPLTKEELLFRWLAYNVFGDPIMYSNEESEEITTAMKDAGVEFRDNRIPLMFRRLFGHVLEDIM